MRTGKPADPLSYLEKSVVKGIFQASVVDEVDVLTYYMSVTYTIEYLQYPVNTIYFHSANCVTLCACKAHQNLTTLLRQLFISRSDQCLNKFFLFFFAVFLEIKTLLYNLTLLKRHKNGGPKG